MKRSRKILSTVCILTVTILLLCGFSTEEKTLSKEENKGIQVYIGNEAPVQNMKDCSVGTATYELGEGMQGTIGIIGPKRMDYENVMKTLKTLMNELDEIFHKEK